MISERLKIYIIFFVMNIFKNEDFKKKAWPPCSCKIASDYNDIKN